MREFAYNRFTGRVLGEKAMDTRERLYVSCEALIRLGVKYRNITPRAVVKGCDDMANASFYQFWGSADELIEEIYEDWYDDNRICSPHLWAMVNLIRKEK